MRILRYDDGGTPRWGVLSDGVVHAVDPPAGPSAAGPSGAYGWLAEPPRPGPAVGPVESVRLLAPLIPGKVVCVGRNYADHAAEFGNPVPAEPLIFLKPSSSIVGPDDDIVYPALSSRLDPEAELVAVIGRAGRRVAESEAMSMVAGYTCGNDVTARDIQKSDPQWTRGKGFDTFCPLGPWIDTEFDPADVRVTCSVDGEVRQDGRTTDFIFDLPTLIAYVTAFTRLEPGDVLMTGTPPGVGPVQVGASVTVEIEGLGRLTNRVVADPE